jgi:hypothetical protein
MVSITISTSTKSLLFTFYLALKILIKVYVPYSQISELATYEGRPKHG